MAEARGGRGRVGSSFRGGASATLEPAPPQGETRNQRNGHLTPVEFKGRSTERSLRGTRRPRPLRHYHPILPHPVPLPQSEPGCPGPLGRPETGRGGVDGRVGSTEDTTQHGRARHTTETKRVETPEHRGAK